MTVQLALLRAINLGSHNKVAMPDLIALFDKLGLSDTKSVLQTGNLVFSDERTGEELEGLLEREAAERIGLRTTFFVRTAKELATLITKNPFREEAERDPAHLVVVFLKEAPHAARVKALEDAIVGRESIRAHGREAYITYPDGIGRSKLTNVLIERKLETASTARNWNTVLKLYALAQARAEQRTDG